MVNNPTGTFSCCCFSVNFSRLRVSNAIHVSFNGSLGPKVVQIIVTSNKICAFFIIYMRFRELNAVRRRRRNATAVRRCGASANCAAQRAANIVNGKFFGQQPAEARCRSRKLTRVLRRLLPEHLRRKARPPQPPKINITHTADSKQRSAAPKTIKNGATENPPRRSFRPQGGSGYSSLSSSSGSRMVVYTFTTSSSSSSFS